MGMPRLQPIGVADCDGDPRVAIKFWHGDCVSSIAFAPCSVESAAGMDAAMGG
jgi:hypothetical protein